MINNDLENIDLKDVIMDLIITLKELDTHTFISEIKQSEEYKKLSPKVKSIVSLIMNLIMSLKQGNLNTFNYVKQSKEYKNISPKVKSIIDLIYSEVFNIV